MKTKNTQDVSRRTTNGLLVSALMAGFLTVSATASAAPQAKAPTSNKAGTHKSSVNVKQQKALQSAEQAAAEAEQAATEENEEAEDGLQQPVEQDNQVEQDNNQGEQDMAQGQEPAQAQSAVNSAPRLAGEAGGNVDATPITLQQKIKDKRGELQATQPGQVEVQESRHIRAQ